ncbi:MAG: hypothetical protein IJK58_09200, partial [Clostridia bacterium]|nr:hypothetical protein [Clostridia bacterium]
MKKLTKVLVALLTVIIAVTLAVPAFAGISIAPNGTGWGDNPNNIIHVKKADPKNVIKDGIIGIDEYEKLNVDLDAKTSPLMLVAFTAISYDNPFAMLPTMEYYFSWDETHGFNFAVRNKPVVVQQILEMASGDCPQDDFARNTAYVINFKTDDGDTCLFYALAKRTDNNQYLEGYYTTTKWNQLGATHNYNPEADIDYIITYGDDGYVTIEWSIPLNNFFVNGGGEGSTLEGTISATAGTATTPFGEHDKEDSYAVALGDFGYGVDSKLMKNHVVYNLTGESVSTGTGTG